jgi:hypothetical protein
MQKIIGDEIRDKCKPIWGLDEEKELRGVARDLGIPHLWVMMGISFFFTELDTKFTGLPGNLALCRFHSKHIALRESH